MPANQTYWVAKAHETDNECRAVDAAGTVRVTDCLAELPALCTQSAPLSNTTAADSGHAWQVVQAVGEGTLMTGYRDYHAWKFRGVRYTRPPARFGYSTEPYLESGEVVTVTAGADCVQPIGEVKNGSSEDCLFLNIWTPHLPRMAGAQRRELRPVMLYLYGGGLVCWSPPPS